MSSATLPRVMYYLTGCPTRYRTRHFFNNFTTNKDFETKFEADLPHCLRNVTTMNLLLFKFRCNIFIGVRIINPLNAELNPICYLLALLGAHHFLHVSRIRVKSLTLRLLMSYIYIYRAPILDVSRSHTTTQHIR